MKNDCKTYIYIPVYTISACICITSNFLILFTAQIYTSCIYVYLYSGLMKITELFNLCHYMNNIVVFFYFNLNIFYCIDFTAKG